MTISKNLMSKSICSYQMHNSMETSYKIAFLLSASLLAGCSSEDSLEEASVREIRATLNGFQLGESLTRTQYNISEAKGFETVWATGDVLGIYPIGGDQVSFPISDGVGTTSAKFDGGSWALRGEYKYAAYYPFSTDFYTTDQTAIPVSFLGQVQNGNNTTSHLAAVDFMAAAGTQPSSNGSVNLSFNHVGCFLRMQFTMPKAGTFTSVTIATDGGNFTTEGTVNLAAATPALSATSTDTKLTLDLTNVKTTADNQTITLYMMVAPGNLSSSNLTFTVQDNAGKSYSKTAAGKNMIATYAYNYSLTLETIGTGGSTGGGGWDDSSDSYNGHAYVDLGLPSGLKWATMNVGATTPEGYGDYFAWGETEPYYTAGHAYDTPCSNWKTGKTGYNWASYKWCNGSYTMTKYCDQPYSSTFDNKTVLDFEDDAARQNWGGSWRMPTIEEFHELYKKCIWEWTTLNNVNGYKLTGSNGNWIFLPAAGARFNEIITNYSTSGYYWSSFRSKSSQSNIQEYARMLSFSSGDFDDADGRLRHYGQSVRPVTE